MPERMKVAPEEALLFFQALDRWWRQDRDLTKMTEIDAKEAAGLFFQIADSREEREVALTFEESRDISNALGASPLPTQVKDHLLEQLPVIAKREETSLVPLYGRRFRELRDRVIRRDGEECQQCGMSREKHENQYGYDLHVHHKTPITSFETPELAHSTDNLITLCVSCHRNVEGGEQ